MLGEDSRTRRFVGEMARVNHGRAFFTSPDSLGEYLLTDYVANRGAKAA